MYIQDNFLILEDKDIKKDKKITGSRFGKLCGVDAFDKQGDVMLDIIGLLPFQPIDVFYTDRGAIAEKIIAEFHTIFDCEFKTWNPKAIKYDNFKNVKYFGGMLDMLVTEPFTQLIEIKSKSLSKKDSTLKYPNESYELQALLYSKLSNIHSCKLIYVFFTEEEEDEIRKTKDLKYDIQRFIAENRICEIFIPYDEQKIRNYMSKALGYKLACLSNKKIPLKDISEKNLKLLNLK